ncbi:MAG: hypothetical protein M1133_12515 [Armatimonadetes bacterium]|nr:hypothetical protein [Armatimonadota bacterium]
MRAGARFLFFSVLMMAAGTQGRCDRLMGEVAQVTTDSVRATFPAPIKPGSMMIVMSGKGESTSGVAISQTCNGRGPYTVAGKIHFVSSPMDFAAGKSVYVDSSNSGAIPSGKRRYVGGDRVGDPNLNFYYYTAAQNVGYGAFGLGYERSIRIARGVALEADAGVSTVGSLASRNADVINTDQLIKTMNGRLRFNLGRDFGVYSGYRWSEGRGDPERWDRLSGQLAGKSFTAPSSLDSGSVLLQGLEYGLSLRPVGKFSMSVGYIPSLRTDYGAFGVRSEPGYTGELRFGTGKGAIRLRGIKSDGYWSADLGVTIK